MMAPIYCMSQNEFHTIWLFVGPYWVLRLRRDSFTQRPSWTDWCWCTEGTPTMTQQLREAPSAIPRTSSPTTSSVTRGPSSRSRLLWLPTQRGSAIQRSYSAIPSTSTADLMDKCWTTSSSKSRNHCWLVRVKLRNRIILFLLKVHRRRVRWALNSDGLSQH